MKQGTTRCVCALLLLWYATACSIADPVMQEQAIAESPSPTHSPNAAPIQATTITAPQTSPTQQPVQVREKPRYPDVPTYPGAVWTGKRLEYGVQDSFWQTDDSFDDVFAYYKQMLPGQGWNYDGTFYGGGDAREQYEYVNGPNNPDFLLRILLDRSEGHTKITLQLTYLSNNRKWLAEWPRPTTVPGIEEPTSLERIDAAEQVWLSKNISAYEFHYHSEIFISTVSALLTVRDGRVVDCKDMNSPASYIRPTAEPWPEDILAFLTAGPTPPPGSRPTNLSVPTEQSSQEPLAFSLEPENICAHLTEADRQGYTMSGLFQRAREIAKEAETQSQFYDPTLSVDAENGYIEMLRWDMIEAGQIDIRSFRRLD